MFVLDRIYVLDRIVTQAFSIRNLGNTIPLCALYVLTVPFLYTLLYYIVSAQRRAYKTITSGATGSTAMTLERAAKLKQLGFEWEAVNPNNVSWETRYNELIAFVVGSALFCTIARISSYCEMSCLGWYPYI